MVFVEWPINGSPVICQIENKCMYVTEFALYVFRGHWEDSLGYFGPPISLLYLYVFI